MVLDYQDFHLSVLTCVQNTEHRSSKIAYLPLIPLSPTYSAVLEEKMIRIATTTATLGNKYTIIPGDQATYEIALAIRNKDEHMFCNLIKKFYC